MATEQPIYISFPVLLFSMMVAPLGALLGLVVTRDYVEETPANGTETA